MNRVLLERAEIGPDHRVALGGRRAAHLQRVLGVKPGDRLRIGVLDGPRGQGRVLLVEPGRVVLACELEERIPPRPAVDLILACPRPKVLGRLWAPLASLGVGHVAVTNAWRVERCYFDSHQLDPASYRPALIEGLEQAGCTRLPTVSVHKRLVVLLEDELEARFGPARRLVADPRGGERVQRALAGGASRRVVLAVGPEGGWIERELELFARFGFVPVQAGGRVLRSDVACCVLLGLIHDALAER